jgi:TPR repeat protein
MASYKWHPGERPAPRLQVREPEGFFKLGMDYSVGHGVPVDLVSAHKWFNIAAQRGHQDAIRLRREIAEQMSGTDIAAAQRAARDWITRH